MTPPASRSRRTAQLESVRAVGNLGRCARPSRRRPRTAAWRSPAPPATTGIGHTRWATHGRVTEENAHPHFDTDDRVHVVVNGIVENYMELKQELLADGAVFTSETDAEVIAHLISQPPRAATDLVDGRARRAYARLRGHYAFVAVAADEPGVLVARPQGVPAGRRPRRRRAVPRLRDPRLPRPHAPRAADRERRDRRRPPPTASSFMRADGAPVERAIEEVDWDAEAAEKGGYETFMLKEIHEQADAVAETIADRTARGDGVDLGDLGTIDDDVPARLPAHRRRRLRHLLPRRPDRPLRDRGVGARRASRWTSRPSTATATRWSAPATSSIGITQSGETADTLAAMRLARERGATVLAVTNIMGSQATRDADGVLFTRAGLEVGVAATKTFVAQVAAMYLLALRHGRAARHARRPSGCASSSPSSSASRTASTRCSPTVDERVERVAEAHYDAGLLPLPRPPRRPAGRARGRAQAQGDLLHRDRRLRGGRDEARPDRAARRGHAGRRASRPTRRCSRRSSPTCRRSAPAARTSSRSRPRATRSIAEHAEEVLRVPRDRLDAPAAARGHPAAAAGLPDRAPARPERRPAAQPGQDRHRRVARPFAGVEIRMIVLPSRKSSWKRAVDRRRGLRRSRPSRLDGSRKEMTPSSRRQADDPRAREAADPDALCRRAARPRWFRRRASAWRRTRPLPAS